MKKADFIAKYGIEKYNENLKFNRENHRKHREENPNWEKERYKKKYEKRKRILAENNELRINFSKLRVKNKQKSYVENGRIDLIQNYELAKADNFNNWEIHHRLELHPDGSVRFTMKSLKELDLYYNRPPVELIWLTSFEHNSIHHKHK